MTRENFVSFLYKLHYTLHIPEFWGSDRWGMRLLGVIAIVWTLDCFVGFYLRCRFGKFECRTCGERNPSTHRGFWAMETGMGNQNLGQRRRINFDIHRAFGLWTWLLLFVIAFTAFSLNLISRCSRR